MADRRGFSAQLSGAAREQLEAELASLGITFADWVRNQLAASSVASLPRAPVDRSMTRAVGIARAEASGYHKGMAERDRQLELERERIRIERGEVERLKREAQQVLAGVNAQIDAHNQQAGAYAETWRNQGRQDLESALVSYRISGNVSTALVQAITARAEALYAQWLAGHITAASPVQLLALAAVDVDQVGGLTGDAAVSMGSARPGEPPMQMRPSDVATLLRVMAARVHPGPPGRLKDLPRTDPPPQVLFDRLTDGPVRSAR